MAQKKLIYSEAELCKLTGLSHDNIAQKRAWKVIPETEYGYLPDARRRDRMWYTAEALDTVRAYEKAKRARRAKREKELAERAERRKARERAKAAESRRLAKQAQNRGETAFSQVAKIFRK